MKPNYKVFKNRLCIKENIANNKTSIEVVNTNENQTAYKNIKQ